MTTEQTKQTEPRSVYVPEFIGAGTGEAWISQASFVTRDEALAFGLMIETDLTSKFNRVVEFQEIQP